MERLTKKIVLTIGFIACTFFVINRIFFFSSGGLLEQIARTATYPILRLSGTITSYINQIRERKESYEQLQQKYVATKQAYIDLLNQNIQLKATLHYDNLSKELRDFQQRYNQTNMMLAKILVKNITSDEHYFLVNKGLHDGVKKDMIAVYKFQIVGKVTDVFNNYCKVLLITDQMCKVAAYTNQTASQGILRGQNSIDRCTMNYVSHLFKVVDHDLVLSSGQGLVFPEGFCVGRIVHHELKEKSLYHTIEVEPIVNLQAIDFCLLTAQACPNITIPRQETVPASPAVTTAVAQAETKLN